MSKQLLHLVFGGELVSLNAHEFRDLSKLHVVGIYPNFKEAQSAWKAAAQATVDNAHMRYFVVHMHRLLDGEEDHAHGPDGQDLPVTKAKVKPKPKPKPKPKLLPKGETKALAKPKAKTVTRRR